MSKRTVTIGKWDGNPIEWIVLKEESFGTLVLSNDILFSRKFDDSTTDWSQSDICKYLNNDFYNTAFTESEKKVIINSKITDNDNISEIKENYKKRGWSTDFADVSISTCKCDVFLLSLIEANSLLTQKEVQISYHWWLRTIHLYKDCYNSRVLGINTDGNLYNAPVTNVYGIRPAMWIREK